jgi:hypothetical protein
MKSSFEDPAVIAAMRAVIAAVDALEATTDDSQVLERASAKSLAVMNLRKRLEELGWLAPARLRVGGPS